MQVFRVVLAAGVIASLAAYPCEEWVGRRSRNPGRTGFVSDLAEEIHVSVRSSVVVAGLSVDGSRAALDHLRWVAGRLEAMGRPLPLDPLDVALSLDAPRALGDGRLLVPYEADIGMVAFSEIPPGPAVWHGFSTTLRVPSEPDAVPHGDCTGEGPDLPSRVEHSTVEDVHRRFDPALCQEWARFRTVDAVVEARAPGDSDRTAPGYGALASDGRLTVAALFGQMDDDGGDREDQGTWSMGRFEDALAARGFARRDDDARGWRRFSKRVCPEMDVAVSIVPPSDLPRDRVEPTAANIVLALRDHDVLYFAGHSGQKALAVLDDAGSYPPAEYRIVVVDACWSLERVARRAILASGTPSPGRPSRLHVVSNANRNYAGNVDAFIAFLDPFLASASEVACGGTGTPDAWLALLAAMNREAVARLQSRLAENPGTHRRGHELYGVSGLLVSTSDRRTRP